MMDQNGDQYKQMGQRQSIVVSSIQKPNLGLELSQNRLSKSMLVGSSNHEVNIDQQIQNIYINSNSNNMKTNDINNNNIKTITTTITNNKRMSYL